MKQSLHTHTQAPGLTRSPRDKDSTRGSVTFHAKHHVTTLIELVPRLGDRVSRAQREPRALIEPLGSNPLYLDMPDDRGRPMFLVKQLPHASRSTHTVARWQARYPWPRDVSRETGRHRRCSSRSGVGRVGRALVEHVEITQVGCST